MYKYLASPRRWWRTLKSVPAFPTGMNDPSEPSDVRDGPEPENGSGAEPENGSGAEPLGETGTESAVTDAGIYIRESPYLDSFVQVGVASGRVLRVSFPEHPEPNAESHHPVLDRIFEYLEGLTAVDFDDVQVALTVPTDQRRVLEAVRTIPYGDQLDVAGVARLTPDLDPTDDDHLILVRTALDENPAPIIIPDHRVRDGPSAAPPAIEQKLRLVEEL